MELLGYKTRPKGYNFSVVTLRPSDAQADATDKALSPMSRHKPSDIRANERSQYKLLRMENSDLHQLSGDKLPGETPKVKHTSSKLLHLSSKMLSVKDTEARQPSPGTLVSPSKASEKPSDRYAKSKSGKPLHKKAADSTV